MFQMIVTLFANVCRLYFNTKKVHLITIFLKIYEKLKKIRYKLVMPQKKMTYKKLFLMLFNEISYTIQFPIQFKTFSLVPKESV